MLERASSVPPGNTKRLVERRQSRRRRGLIVFSILFLLLLAATLYGLWRPSVRISRVDVYDADVSLVQYAKAAIQGSYFSIIPRDSIFFFPESRIRADILAAHSDVAAVSIFRNGFTGISIKPNDRVPVARWCDSTHSASSGQADSPQAASSTRLNLVKSCYVFDASGFIFATATASIQTINSFTLYAPLEGNALEPLRATLIHANKIPAAFDFARQLDTQGSPVTRVSIRGDEVDDWLASGTRITYVLGHEKDAFTALVSAHNNFNLSDGSVEYVDLRFDGKVYVKKKG